MRDQIWRNMSLLYPEGEPDKTVEASELGWRPGYFPMVCSLGQRLREMADDSGLVYVDYVNPGKKYLVTRVLND